MVGFAKWHYPHRLKGDQQETLAARLGPYPEGTNGPLQDDFNRQMWTKRDKWIDHEKTFCKSIHENFLTRLYNFYLFISFHGLQTYQCCFFRLCLYISLPFQQDPGFV